MYHAANLCAGDKIFQNTDHRAVTQQGDNSRVGFRAPHCSQPERKRRLPCWGAWCGGRPRGLEGLPQHSALFHGRGRSPRRARRWKRRDAEAEEGIETVLCEARLETLVRGRQPLSSLNVFGSGNLLFF